MKDIKPILTFKTDGVILSNPGTGKSAKIPYNFQPNAIHEKETIRKVGYKGFLSLIWRMFLCNINRNPDRSFEIIVKFPLKWFK